jgi:hypothetical protein
LAITDIRRDLANPNLVRVTTTDTLATVQATNYVTGQIANTTAINNGLWQWLETDTVLCYCTDGNQFFEFSGTDYSSFLVMGAGNGSVILPVVSGDFAMYSGTAGALNDLGYSPTNAAKTKVVMADGATTSGYLGVFADAAGTVGMGALAGAIHGGDIQAGLDAVPGMLSSYPLTTTRGSLIYKAMDNAGDFTVTVSNASHAQSSVYSIIDCGVASANFIMSQYVGTQVISTGGLQLLTGNFIAGQPGTSLRFVAFPPTAARGTFEMAAQNNSGDFIVSITNGVHGQSSIYNVTDCGQAVGSIMTSTLDSADPSSNTFFVDVTVSVAALNAGSVAVVPAAGTKQYKVRSIAINSGGTNFSGGGGDRPIALNDAASTWTLIAAVDVQTLPGNQLWGGANVPLPTGNAINVSSVAGASIFFSYAGGTTNYTAGTVDFTIELQRVA